MTHEEKTKVIYIVIYLLCMFFLHPVAMVLFISSISQWIFPNNNARWARVLKLPNDQLWAMSNKLAGLLG